MNSKLNAIRQGDVYLVPVASIPQGACRADATNGVVLAYGEVTGHAHRIAAGSVQLWEAETQRYITVPEGAQRTVTIPRCPDAEQGARYLNSIAPYVIGGLPSMEEWTTGPITVTFEGEAAVHEEHRPVPIPRGEYAVIQQVEYTPEALRTVAD